MVPTAWVKAGIHLHIRLTDIETNDEGENKTNSDEKDDLSMRENLENLLQVILI